jgi:TetR/AcrR family transcriptional regulator, acrAB operon repressor
MPRRTKDEAQVTRQQLLDAALTVFSAKGYSATRLEDIAAEAGVTRGAIYHHFGGKVELYDQLMQEITSEVDPLIEQAITEGQGALDTLRRIFVIPLEYAASNARYRQAAELMFFKTEAIPEMDGAMHQKTEGIEQFTQRLTAIVERGMAAGEIRREIDARDAAVALGSLQNGLLALWMMGDTLIDLKNRAGKIADIFLRGIAVLD